MYVLTFFGLFREIKNAQVFGFRKTNMRIQLLLFYISLNVVELGCFYLKKDFDLFQFIR